MRGSGDPHPDHLTGSDPPSAQNTTSSGPEGLGPETPWAPVVCIPAAHPVTMVVGSIRRDGHGPNGNGDGGLCRCGPWCAPPPSPPCSPSTYHHPIPPIPSLGAHGHHAIWLMTANGPPPISVIQTSGSSSAMACIHPHPSVHHPLRIPTPWRWGAYGGRAMVLMVLGMEGHHQHHHYVWGHHGLLT